jgi:hypothetical protein
MSKIRVFKVYHLCKGKQTYITDIREDYLGGAKPYCKLCKTAHWVPPISKAHQDFKYTFYEYVEEPEPTRKPRFESQSRLVTYAN